VTYYAIPTKSTSALIPDMTLYMDMPIQKMAADALQALWPEIVGRAQQAMPAFVSAAWPSAAAYVPAAVDVAWPSVEAKLPAASQVAWDAVLPTIREEVATTLKREELRAGVAAGVLTALLLGGGYLAATRLGLIGGARAPTT